MVERYTISNLNQDKVQVKKQTYVEYLGQMQPIGELWFRGYVNSDLGRLRVSEELPQAQVNAIMAVWGDKPTVEEVVIEQELNI